MHVTCNVLSLSSIVQVPGVDGTVRVLKIRRRRAKGLGLITKLGETIRLVTKNHKFYHLRKIKLSFCCKKN